MRTPILRPRSIPSMLLAGGVIAAWLVACGGDTTATDAGTGTDSGTPDAAQDVSTKDSSAQDATPDAQDAAPTDAADEGDGNLCGNGTVDNGEDCDLGSKNSDLFSSCSSTCKTTSLVLHLDASDPKGDGTLPADGTQQAAWKDLATGITVVQATTADQPVFRTSAVGGKPAMEFDGLSTFFDADLDINQLTDVTIVVVVQNKASAPGPYSGIWGADLGGWGRFMSAIGTQGGNGVSNGAGYTAITGLNATDTPLVVSTRLAGITANGSDAYVNGVLGATFTGSTVTSDTHLSIGSLNGPTHFISGYQEYGYIAEVLVYNTTLSDTDRGAVETALMAKY